MSESEVIALHNSEISLEIAAPQLISPAHETFTNDLSPIFTWHSADTTYWSRLQISFSPTFDSLWHDGLGSDTTQQVGLIGGRYYWRVKDYDGSESSDWSEVRALTVDTTYPYAPVLKGPPDMAWVNGGPGLSWNWAAGVMNCLVQVSADTSFIAIADSATLSDSIYSPSLSDGKYFWRVQSCDSAGNWSGWSEVRRFRLDTYAPRIIATYPVSGQGNVNLSDTVRIIFNEPLVPGSFMYEFSPTVAMVYGGGSASHDTMLLWSDWFQTGTEYTVTISGASDSAGNLLTGGPVPNPWTFTMSTDGVGPEIVHYPAGLPQTAGQPMTVSALVTDPGSGVSAVYLHYRMGGAVDFTALPMAHQGGDSYQADIPGAQVGERGVSYYLRAVDQMGAWSIVPAGAPDQRFHRVVELAVAGPSLAQPARSYRMVSVPFNSPGSPFRPDIFADDLGAYNDTRWRIFRWQSGAYAEYGGVQDIQPGRAYWLITQDSRKIDVDNVHTVADTACHIPLELGWNMVGTPFAYSVYLDEVTVYDGMGGSFGFNDPGNVLTEQQLVYYEGYGYLNVGQLDPWCGYWVRALNSGVTLVVPASAGAGKPALSPQPDGWRLTLSAGINGYHDRENAAGIDPRGAGANASEPPQVDGYVSLAFMNTGRKLAEDYRQEIGQGQSWRFRVGTDQAGTVELGFTEQGQAGGWAYSLYDIAAGRMVPAGGHYSYQSGQGGGARDFVLLAGTPEYIRAEAGRAGLLPAVTLLEQNHPNPFRGRTAISYQLARPGRVDLGVYNLLGQRVRTLAYGMQETGRYTVDWDGRDQAGRLSGSGVYFLRLEADVESCSRRMLLLR